MYSKYMIDQIKNLLAIPSPTGYTHDVTKYLIHELIQLGYEPKQLRKGAVLVKLGGIGEGVLLTSHVDTLGAMVRAVKSNGRLRLTKIGGYPESTIEAENCKVHTRDGQVYTGTVQLVNPAVHVNHEIGNLKRNDEGIELVLDEIVGNQSEVQALNISAGDFVSFDPRTQVTTNGFIKSRYLDDKASCGILLGIAKWIKEEQVTLENTVYLYFTTYEEVGHGGAAGIPSDVKSIIAVDMGAIGDDLGTDEYKVSICAKDSSGPYDYDLTSELVRIAKAHELDFAVDIFPYYSSDASASLRAGYDINHALIGPGISASHGYERGHEKGLKNTFLLLQHFLQK